MGDDPVAGVAVDLWYTPNLITWTHLVDEGVSLADGGESEFVDPMPAETGYISIVELDPDEPPNLRIAVSSDTQTWEPKVALPPGLLPNNAATYSDGRLLAGLWRPGSGIELWLLE